MAKEITKKEIEAGHQAAEMARQDILNACQQEGLTLKDIIRVIKDGTLAESVKQQFAITPQGSGWVEAPALTDHRTRLQAASLARDILGLDAPKKMDVGVKFGSLSPETAELVQNLLTAAMDTAKIIGDVATASLKNFSED